MNPFAERLSAVRSSMLQKGLDIIVVPLSDPHLGEYVPDHWQIIRWLTGFTGSAATVVITGTFAGLWTDSRYFIQARRQLAGSGYQFVKPGAYQRNNYMDFLAENAGSQDTIGIDGRIFSVSNFRRLSKRLEGTKSKIETDLTIIDEIWSDRPELPFSTAFDHALEYSGKDRQVKIDEVREQMEKVNAAYHLLTSPDDIMWLLNIRGSDLKYSPLLLSYALVGSDQVLLFIDEGKIPYRLASSFDKIGIVILPYEDTVEIVTSVTTGSSVLMNPQSVSVSLYNSLSLNSRIIEDITIPTRLKAIKNRTETENLYRVMVKDGTALTKFFHWFETNHGKIRITEKSLSDKLFELRSDQKDFYGLPFATIAAWNENSALPHYGRGEEDEGSEIGERGILLIDSGGHYPGGTTDITRTISVGIPSDQQKKDFTLILKGHINLALAKFPNGTRGYQLDFIARRAMWGSGLNYAHGTGHGVGYFLNVHEGPQSISPADNKTYIEAGMLTSNEPALYREGEYGIRTENLILCYEDEETEFGKFLRFETISLCYIEKALIDKSLLDQNEIDWLNSYHLDVYDKLSPHLSDEEKTWLREKTSLL
ncbi:MAG: aminopeptidase P family protein [Bacteroidales bacterium]|jgi:Xaa-Pro aminopeptidase|nr:aminopeptidase P family protein [Bacteroidales bacterium]